MNSKLLIFLTVGIVLYRVVRGHKQIPMEMISLQDYQLFEISDSGDEENEEEEMERSITQLCEIQENNRYRLYCSSDDESLDIIYRV